jgi:hypothetical protein
VEVVGFVDDMKEIGTFDCTAMVNQIASSRQALLNFSGQRIKLS